MIVFAVRGEPKAQPRPRVSRGHAYNPPSADAWKSQIAAACVPARPERPMDGALSVDVLFLMPRPKTTKRAAHTVKPDLDNLVKAVLDVLTTMDYWHDDSQITDLSIRKRYAEEPGAIITIEEAAAKAK